MRNLTNHNLIFVAHLLQNKNIKEAYRQLSGVDIASLNNIEYGQYCLLMCKTKLLLGDVEVSELIHDAIDVFRDSPDNESFAEAKYCQGWYLSITGNAFEAREVLLEAFLNYKRCNNEKDSSRVLNRLACIQFETGAIDDALINIRRCIDINIRLKNDKNVISLHQNLALMYFATGRFREAINQYDEIEAKTINKYHYYLTYAMAKALQGHADIAVSIINKILPLPDEFKLERAYYFEYLGWIYNLAGRYEDAVKTLKTGIELSLKIAPESALISQSKRLLADAYVGLKDYPLAEKTAVEALAVAEKINERAEIAACKRVFALVAGHKDDSEMARMRFAEAIDVFSQIGSRYELAVTRYLAATSGEYTNGERAAMLYLAHEYFVSEEVAPYIKLVEQELTRFARPVKPEVIAEDAVYIAVNPRSRKIVELAENIAQSDMTVLLTGPTGSGKDQLAKYIHAVSGRDGPLVPVNTAAIPDSMAEAELFGYVKGAFTGAECDKLGLITAADGGTLYLNEIADSSPQFQAKLLEVLESKRVRPLGTTEAVTVRVRVIAATNHDLEARMREGVFRVDLYHRLRGVDIALPPLKDRPEDIAELVRCFFARNGSNGSVDLNGQEFEKLCAALAERDWPGNVREMESAVKRLVVLGGDDIARMAELARDDVPSERERLLRALDETGWNRRETARLLGISEGGVRYRMKKFGINEEVPA